MENPRQYLQSQSLSYAQVLTKGIVMWRTTGSWEISREKKCWGNQSLSDMLARVPTMS